MGLSDEEKDAFQKLHEAFESIKRDHFDKKSTFDLTEECKMTVKASYLDGYGYDSASHEKIRSYRKRCSLIKQIQSLGKFEFKGNRTEYARCDIDITVKAKEGSHVPAQYRNSGKGRRGLGRAV